MANKKNQNRVSPGEQRLNMGISLNKRNPLFSRLGGYLQVLGGQNMGKDAAFVRGDGTIYLNRDALLTPMQWAYTIAHCKLHLAFGHFDAERMPGYEKVLPNGSTQWVVSCNKAVWNMACDIYVSKFLHDIKFGSPTCENPANLFPGNLTDERKIYQYLMEHGGGTGGQSDGHGNAAGAGRYGSAAAGHGGGGNSFGTAEGMDMRDLEHPRVYDAKKNQRNEFMLKFAYALAHSVSSVVSEAGGHGEVPGRTHTASEKAAQWFISHYPLLGGLAAGFRIIEDYSYCNQEEISVAAVNVTAGEIYVNPAAGLNEEELKFVLAHEFLHAGLMHHERCGGRDPYLWNVACDYVINGWLREMGIGEMPDRGLYDEELKDVSAESLYDRMLKDLRKFSKLDTFRGYGRGDVITGPKSGGGFSPSGVTSLDDFYRSALQNGLEYHLSGGRGFLPSGLIEEIRALSMPPIPWDVQLGNWFDEFFTPLAKHRTYARPSRRQGSTPDIPRPSYAPAEIPEYSRTFGVVIDTSGSMDTRLLGFALGAVASYAEAKEVPYARVVFCDAAAYDAGYLTPEEIAGRVQVRGRGGTVLQPGVDLLEGAKDFPENGPILIITDGWIEDHIRIRREHAFLVPRGRRLPFTPRGKVFYFEEV
ncbi:MAG: hypothetical protein K2N94_03005 [Lachnospiraceae bacterium]|nr:hypothetical protein [Lachnospiraceae bacterium]